MGDVFIPSVFSSPQEGKEFGPRNVLAYVLQSYELRLLRPIREMLLNQTSSQRWNLLVWQHDGYSWAPTRREDADHIYRQMQAAVAKEAAELEIPTRLEVKYDGIGLLQSDL